MAKNLKPSLATLLCNQQICHNCFNEFKVDFHYRILNGVRVLSIFEYNDKFRDILFRFKGAGDIELAPIFLNNYRLYLRFKFHNFVMISAPSSKASNDERGFNHVVEAFKGLGLPRLDCIDKRIDFKQSDLGYKERQTILDKLIVHHGEKILGKRVLIVDDLITTGATVLAMISLIKKYQPKAIAVLTLAHTKQLSENNKG